MLTGYLGQEDDAYTGREALIVHFLGGGSSHVASLAKKKRIRGVSYFITFTFNLFISYFRTLGTMFDLSVRGVHKGRLMKPHQYFLICACLRVMCIKTERNTC